jgi:hypothetical protein
LGVGHSIPPRGSTDTAIQSHAADRASLASGQSDVAAKAHPSHMGDLEH